jgi:hypothetical protein
VWKLFRVISTKRKRGTTVVRLGKLDYTKLIAKVNRWIDSSVNAVGVIDEKIAFVVIAHELSPYTSSSSISLRLNALSIASTLS